MAGGPIVVLAGRETVSSLRKSERFWLRGRVAPALSANVLRFVVNRT